MRSGSKANPAVGCVENREKALKEDESINEVEIFQVTKLGERQFQK